MKQHTTTTKIGSTSLLARVISSRLWLCLPSHTWQGWIVEGFFGRNKIWLRPNQVYDVAVPRVRGSGLERRGATGAGAQHWHTRGGGGAGQRGRLLGLLLAVFKALLQGVYGGLEELETLLL